MRVLGEEEDTAGEELLTVLGSMRKPERRKSFGSRGDGGRCTGDHGRLAVASKRVLTANTDDGRERRALAREGNGDEGA